MTKCTDIALSDLVFFFVFRGCAASHALRDAAGRRCAARGTAAQRKAPLRGVGRLRHPATRPKQRPTAAILRLRRACGAAGSSNLSQNLPLAPMHHPTKFHVIPSSSLGGVRRHTNKQTDNQTHFEKYVLDVYSNNYHT